MKFSSKSEVCKKCWEQYVKNNCKGDVPTFDKCEDYKEGCVVCREEFCADAVGDPELCPREK